MLLSTVRSLLAVNIVCLVITVYCVEASPVNRESAASRNLPSKRQTIDEILSEVPLIDGHNDLPHKLYQNVQNQLERVDLNQSLIGIWPLTHTDIPRLRQGRVGAQFWAAYRSCETQYKDAVRACLDQVDVIRRFVAKYPETFQSVTTADGILEAFAAGKIGSLIGMESGHCIDSSLAALRQFYDMGVRYMTLTHNCDTPWADTHSTNPTGRDGLSLFGEQLVAEMNRLGMLVDISHVSSATMSKAISVSQAPVIFSHSGAYALCNSTRNVPDDILELTRSNNGLVMVPVYPDFLTCSSTANLQDVADHIDYIKNRIGVGHVGIGGDYDGIPTTPVGMEDVSKYPDLFQELQNRGWTDEELKKLAGLNLIRVFRDVEQISRTLQETVLPGEEIIPESDLGDNTGCRTT